ncbi:N-acetylmuramoyl-L-alanine amidase [Sporosarcina sp. resist]|nr:N-acetylmuramoyl-L-alanine amidase [Sporosarcina sp. resist]
MNKNKFSRPGYKLLHVKALVIHYTANNGGTADNHFNYFNHLRDCYASAHIFVDRSKALEIIPLNEVAFHANEREKGPLIPSLKATAPYYPGGNANLNSIGIEMCMEKDGTIHPDTIARTLLVLQKLQKQFGVWPIYRHYDVTGKKCPAPFVANEKLWTKFLADMKKEDDELKFSSPTVRKSFEKLLESKATQEIVINAGIEAGAFNESWRTKWENKELAAGDIVGLAVLFATKK